MIHKYPLLITKNFNFECFKKAQTKKFNIIYFSHIPKLGPLNLKR